MPCGFQILNSVGRPWKIQDGSGGFLGLFFSVDRGPLEFHFDPLGSRLGTQIVGRALVSCCSQFHSWSSGCSGPSLYDLRPGLARSQCRSRRDIQNCNWLGKRSFRGGLGYLGLTRAGNDFCGGQLSRPRVRFHLALGLGYEMCFLIN